MSCQSVAVVLTLVWTKQTKKYKYTETKQNTVKTIQNTVNTSTRITKTPTLYKTHTYRKRNFNKILSCTS
jgi:hypothetical protein